MTTRRFFAFQKFRQCFQEVGRLTAKALAEATQSEDRSTVKDEAESLPTASKSMPFT